MTKASSFVETLKVLPLAITRSGNSEGCVGTLTDSGEWIRPQPVWVKHLESPNTGFRYRYWTNIAVTLSTADESRPEDRNLIHASCSSLEAYLNDNEWFSRLIAACDRNVITAFERERSLGLVEVKVCNIYVKRHTGNKQYIRLCFTDSIGDFYDWIIPEITFGQIVWSHVEENAIAQSFATTLLKVLNEVRVFTAIGLTLSNNRFPGKFRGCHPLVVGMHTIPDYRTLLESVLSNQNIVV